MTQGSTKNSISSLLQQFLTVQTNSLSIINAMNTSATTTDTTVTVQLLDERGIPQTREIPAFSAYEQRLNNLESSLQSLAGILPGSSSTVRNPDGTYSKIFQYALAKNPVPLTGLVPPSKFSAKNNYFFESFLTPLLYVSFQVGNQIPPETNRIYVRRVILNTDTSSKQQLFDDVYNGKNGIDYNTFINYITDAGISYYLDDEEVTLPSHEYRFVGNFGVVNIVDSISSGNKVRFYYLDTLNYTDTLTNSFSSVTLSVGDRLATSDGTRYRIEEVNASEKAVRVIRETGLQPISLGTNILSIASPIATSRDVRVNVGYDERQVIFFKTIDDRFNLIGSSWSLGVGFYSNSLTINTDSGVLTLEEFYLTQVADIGKQFLNQAKERIVTSVDALIPDAPTINESNFKVVQINSQITNSPTTEELKNKNAQKSQLKTDIDQIDVKLQNLRAQLNVNTSYSVNLNSTTSSSISGLQDSGTLPAQFTVTNQQIQNQINQLIDERSKKVQLYTTLVGEISALQLSTPQITEPPVYAVRGFWDFPSPKFSNATGYQEVIQFIVRSRYLNTSGDAGNTQQITFTNSESNKVIGSFSSWNQYKTDIRKKVYDSTTGTYVWAPEDVGNPDVTNVNQLDIPISQGQQVEIQIASISEGGWPYNPATSDFSTSVIVSFPTEFTSNNSNQVFFKQNQTDETTVIVENQMQSMGVNQHLGTQFSQGNKFYAHSPGSISSGFFKADGSPQDLFEKLTDLQNQIDKLSGIIGTLKGSLEVYIVDPSGARSKISASSIYKSTAPFYNDVYANPADKGKIITVQYQLQIVNAVATPLELASMSPGGLSTIVSNTLNINNYSSNLRYNEVPLSITSLVPSNINSLEDYRQSPPFASAPSNSQWLYSRYQSLGYDVDLYFSGSTGASGYNFNGTGGEPRNGDILIPYLPGSSGVTNPNVWNGTYATGPSISPSPAGNGTLSEFCIHKGHPSLNAFPIGSVGDTFTNIVRPGQTGGTNYPAFRHARYFQLDVSQQDYYKQLSFDLPTTYNSSSPQDYMYPNKLGFNQADQYLVGKYSCGAYLFIGPVTMDLIQVEGSTSLARQLLYQGETNAVIVPIIFQYRAQDILGYIGGYRTSGSLNNITYTKRIGIDIKVANVEQFSFDVEITGKYQNDQPVLNRQSIVTKGSTYQNL
jgi:hypothetical protein